MMAVEEQPTTTDEQTGVLTGEAKEQAIAEAAEKLKTSAYGISMEISWFSSSRSATKDEKQAMIGEDGPDIDMVSMSYQKLDKKNEYIKKMNECRSAITAYRDSMTIPAAQIPLSNVAVDSGGNDVVGSVEEYLQKRAGERIIMQTNIEDFEKQLNTVLIPNLNAAVEEANKHIDEIREDTKKKLKSKFKEEEFPDKFVVGVRGPHYTKLGLDSTFEELCPTAAARMKKVMQKQFQDTVDLAVADFARDFLDLIDLVIKQVSLRYKIRPPQGHKYQVFSGAVITGVLTSADDHEIPAGQKCYEVSYKEGGTTKLAFIGPMTDEEYKELRPVRAQEKGKIYEGTLDQLLYNLGRFNQIAELLGDFGKPLEGIVNKVQDILKVENVESGKQLANKLKTSSYLRDQTAKSLDQIAESLSGMVSKMPVKKKTRKRALVM